MWTINFNTYYTKANQCKNDSMSRLPATYLLLLLYPSLWWILLCFNVIINLGRGVIMIKLKCKRLTNLYTTSQHVSHKNNLGMQDFFGNLQYINFGELPASNYFFLIPSSWHYAIDQSLANLDSSVYSMSPLLGLLFLPHVSVATIVAATAVVVYTERDTKLLYWEMFRLRMSEQGPRTRSNRALSSLTHLRGPRATTVAARGRSRMRAISPK